MRRNWIGSAVLFGVTFLTFSRVLVADFVQWDDDISVARNQNVQGLDWARVGWMFTDTNYAMRYKPLTWLTYALIYQCAGLRPFAYHLVNLLVHSLNAVLVFFIIQRLLWLSARPGSEGELRARPPEASPNDRATLPAAIGALLWGCQPLRVEPVARVTDLTYCLVAFFLMISLWFYLRAYASGTGRVKPGLYGCSVGAYAIAMLVYPFAFGWAAVLLAIDWFPLRRFAGEELDKRTGRFAGLVREKLPFLMWGALVFTTLLARRNPSVVWEQPVGPALGWFARGMQAFYVWGYYLWRPWVPFHLSPVYTTLIHFDANRLRFWLSAAVVLGLTALLVSQRKRWPWACVLWIAYLTLLLPALGLTEHPHYTSDRYDYLAGLVLAVAVAAVLWKIRSRGGGLAAMAVCTMLAVGWAGLSYHQMRIWRNSVSLFEHMVRELGNDARRNDLRRRLGSLYEGQGRLTEAVEQYQAALRVEPDVKTYQALAGLLEQQGNAAGALTNYLAALRLSAEPLIHCRAAAQLLKLGRVGEAASHYREALKSWPDLIPALEQLAWIRATDTNPQNRDGAEAIQLAERACKLTEQKAAAALSSLAAAYAEAGRFPEATATAQRARDRAGTAGEARLAEKYQKLMERFAAGEAWRE